LVEKQTSISGARIDTLSGKYIIYQPKEGQRYSTDDMLVAWLSVKSAKKLSPSPNSFLDLGSGLCSVPMIFLWAFPGTDGYGMEISHSRFMLGKKSLEANGLSCRFKLLHGDIRDKFLDKKFEIITSSPPYYRKDEGPISPDKDKAGVRFELNGTIFDYFKSASHHIEEGGFFTTVYPFQYAKRVFDAAKKHDFCCDLKIDVIPKKTKPPLISLFRFIKGSKGINANEKLAIRNEDQSFTKEYNTVRRELGFKEKV